jgi:hypothetical protein
MKNSKKLLFRVRYLPDIESFERFIGNDGMNEFRPVRDAYKDTCASPEEIINPIPLSVQGEDLEDALERATDYLEKEGFDEFVILEINTIGYVIA